MSEAWLRTCDMVSYDGTDLVSHCIPTRQSTNWYFKHHPVKSLPLYREKGEWDP